MENVTLAEAKEHLEELIVRAARGEDVRILDPKIGAVRLTPIPDSTATTSVQRMPGRWKDRLPEPPPGFFVVLSEEELKDWYETHSTVCS